MLSLVFFVFDKLTFFGASTVICSKANSFFGLPRWYQYLPYARSTVTGKCEINISVHDWGTYWLIALALLNMLLRVAGMVALAFVIYGGFVYITSQGEPDKIAEARRTIVNALVGMIIAIMATWIVGFIAHRLGGS